MNAIIPTGVPVMASNSNDPIKANGTDNIMIKG